MYDKVYNDVNVNTFRIEQLSYPEGRGEVIARRKNSGVKEISITTSIKGGEGQSF